MNSNLKYAHPRIRNSFKGLICLALLGIPLILGAMTAPAIESGSKDPKDSEKDKASKDATPKVIEGFDISLLFGDQRAQAFRLEFQNMTADSQQPNRLSAEFNVALEFGSDVVFPEIHTPDRTILVRELIQSRISQFSGDELRTVRGKMQLKEEIATALNKTLKTGRVRKIYFTHLLYEFHDSPGSNRR